MSVFFFCVQLFENSVPPKLNEFWSKICVLTFSQKPAALTFLFEKPAALTFLFTLKQHKNFTQPSHFF